MKRTVCDLCKDPTRSAEGVFLSIGRKMDAAGDMDDDGVTIDLCPMCHFKILREAFSAAVNDVYERGRILVQIIEKLESKSEVRRA